MMMKFEYMNNNHTNINFAKIMNNFFRQHNFQHRMTTMIFDNVSNNGILFLKFIRNMFVSSNCVNITNKKAYLEKSKITHVLCLAHMLQLTLQIFLKNVRINFTNDKLQKN